MEPLTHCIYASAAAQPFDDLQLRRLLRHARAANERRGITGMLVHSAGSFFQVLEGPAASVNTIYEIIAADPRHERITRIIDEPIPRRSFSAWTMGYAERTAAELETLDGMNDFFAGANCLAEIDEGRARKLLLSFARGRWRSTPSPASPASATA